MKSDRKASPCAAASLLNRYVWLIDTIRYEKKITFNELNKKWLCSSLNETGEELALRTFHNHRKAIFDFFGISIECDKKDGYTYHIENFDIIIQNNLRTWLLNSLFVNNLINESRDLKNRILFEHIPSGDRHLTPIIHAMRSEVCLEIVYQSFWKETTSNFVVEPYCVKAFRQRWYLLGKSDQLRVYALDRIQSVHATQKKFDVAEDFDAESYFSNSYGVVNVGQVEKIQIKVFKCSKKDMYLLSLPLHPSQQVEKQTKDYVIFSYFMQPTYDFRQELLSYGSEIEVLSPGWFRAEISEIVTEQAHLYKQPIEEIGTS